MKSEVITTETRTDGTFMKFMPVNSGQCYPRQPELMSPKRGTNRIKKRKKRR